MGAPIQTAPSGPLHAKGRARSPWPALIVLCLGSFAILLDATIVSVAIPTVLPDLHASLDQAVWITNAYLLVFAALLILGSRLGDMFGARRLFVIGLVLFALSSALCGAAQTPGQLIASRALQGIGAAAMAPQGGTIIRMIFPRERMGTAYGIFSMMVGLAAVSGPTLGGLLTTNLDWRWVFYVNLPITVVAIAGAYRYVPDLRTVRRHRLDPVGVALAAAGLAAVVYGLIEGQRYDWGNVGFGIAIPEIIGAGLAVLAVFVIWERCQDEPLIPLKLLQNRTFALLVTLAAAMQFALQSMLLVNSFTMQSVLGMTAIRAGLTSLPLTIALVAVAPLAGRLTDRIGGRLVVMGGFVAYAVGIAGIALVSSVHATPLNFAVPLLIGGVGMGAVFAPLTTESMRAAPLDQASSVAGMLNVARQLGATLGGAITGAVLANRLASAMSSRAATAAEQLPPAARAPFVAGFDHAASGGLQVGRGQSGVQVPHDVPAVLVPQIRSLTNDVFTHGYIAAMRPTLAVSIAILLIGAASCLLLRLSRSAQPESADRNSAHVIKEPALADHSPA